MYNFYHALVVFGPLAQLAEQRTLNPSVAGSSPARPTYSSMAKNSKRKTYILITFCFLTGLILLQNFSTGISAGVKKNAFDAESIVSSLAKNPFFISLGLLYFSILIAGIVNTVILLVKKAGKKRLFPDPNDNQNTTLYPPAQGTTGLPARLHSNQESNWKTLAFILFSVYIISFITLISISNINNKYAIFSIVIFCNFLLELAVIIIILKQFSKNRLGLIKKYFYPHKVFMIYSSFILLLIPAALFNQLLLKGLNTSPTVNPIISLFLSTKDTYSTYLLLFQIVILGPLAEELFFRGFLFRWLRGKISFRNSALAVSCIFAIMHRTPAAFLPLFFLSLLLCFIYERTKNLFNSIFLHSFHNFLGALFLIIIKLN